MPYNVRTVYRLALTHVRFSGVVSALDLKHALTTVLGGPDHRPGSRILWDHTAASSLDLTPEDVDDVVALAVHLRRRAPERGAVLAHSDAVEAFASLLERKAQGPDGPCTRVFRDPAKAAAWLGLPDLGFDVPEGRPSLPPRVYAGSRPGTTPAPSRSTRALQRVPYGL